MTKNNSKNWLQIEEEFRKEYVVKSNKPFNFKAFENLCNKKSKSIFIELLTGDISVANL